MFHRGAQMIRTSAGAFRVGDWTLNQFDPDGLRSVANVLVWVHWFIVATCFVQLVYRPHYGAERFAVYTLLYLTLVALTAYAHYRLASGRNITWRWVFALCSLDAALISAAAVTGGGFGHYFFHLFYYPVLAGFAVFFTSFRLNMVFVTVVAVVYLLMSLLVGDGIDLGAREEKPLFARIVVMYAVVAVANVISRFERTRWRAAVERERALQRERAELSQAIHDTTAQSAYMIGLGIDAVRQLVGDSNEEVRTRLEATSLLSKTAIWQLRHPIDLGAHLRGPGAGPDPGVPRLDVHPGHLGAGRPGAARGGAAPDRGGQEPALLHRPQRPDQRLPPRRGGPGVGGAGLQARAGQPVGVRRRQGAARGLRRAGPRVRQHGSQRPAAGRDAGGGAARAGRRGQGDLRDAPGPQRKRRGGVSWPMECQTTETPNNGDPGNRRPAPSGCYWLTITRS